MKKTSLPQLSPQSSPPNRQFFQTINDQNESPFLSPNVELFERHQYKVRNYKPQLTVDRIKPSSKQIASYLTNEMVHTCRKCKCQKEKVPIRLCPCLDIFYHTICIVEYADQNPKMGLDIFRCQYCSNYFPLQIKEKLSVSNIDFKERLKFMLCLSGLLSLIVLEISLLVLLLIELIYQILIIILILLEILIILVISMRIYRYSNLVEYDIKEYKLGYDYNQQMLEINAIKIVKQLQYKRAKRVVL